VAGTISSPSSGKVKRVKAIKPVISDKTPMTATPQELAERTVPRCPEGQTLRLKPTMGRGSASGCTPPLPHEPDPRYGKLASCRACQGSKWLCCSRSKVAVGWTR